MGKRPTGVQLLTRNDFNRMRMDALESTAPADATGPRSGSASLFLWRYSPERMESFLRETGFLRHLNEIGYLQTSLVIRSDPSGLSTFRIYMDPVSPENLLIDLRVSEQRFYPLASTNQNIPVVYDMVLVEWFHSRDSRSMPEKTGDRLPGQERPGLGALRSFFRLMGLVGADISRDGFMAVPDHLHAALMYAGTFHFYDPFTEGIVRAIRRDLSAFSLADIAWGHLSGAISDTVTGSPFVYDPSVQIFPVSRRMIRYFRSRSYLALVREAYAAHAFVLDSRILEKRRKTVMEEDSGNL